MARILVVDDEALVRQTLRSILERAGHEVVEAHDGDGCLETFSASEPDLVLIDIIMPNREGVETIAELRARGSSVPILAMSGGGRTAGGMLFLHAAERLGATRTLTKPIRGSQLLGAVQECLAVAA